MLSDTISNWGRWGSDDQRGTLNLLTPEVVKKAACLIKRGKVYSLAVPLEKEGPNRPSRNKTWHVTTVREDKTGIRAGAADDILVMHTHGTTHIDALCHFWYQGQLYNGYPSDLITREGSPKNAIDNVRWLVGRGVLLDLATWKGMEHLPMAYVITPADLEGCAAWEGVSIQVGDIVLIRTGWYRLFSRDRQYHDSGEPGVGEGTIPWFCQKQVCALGVDNGAVEVEPTEAGGPLVVHARLIRDVGMYLMEYLDLEELARDRTYEFLFVAAPLRITGGIGSPLNPLAIA